MRKLVILLMCFGLLVSCSNEDEIDINVNKKSNNNIEDNSMSKIWNLKSYSGFLGTVQLKQNDVQWVLNENLNQIQVVNNIGESLPYMIESGTYNYTLIKGEMTINKSFMYTVGVDGNLFILRYKDNPVLSDDEYTLIFLENEELTTITE